MSGQMIIVIGLVVLAAVYVLRSSLRSITKSGCGSGCGKCSSTVDEPPRSGTVPLNVIKDSASSNGR